MVMAARRPAGCMQRTTISRHSFPAMLLLEVVSRHIFSQNVCSRHITFHFPPYYITSRHFTERKILKFDDLYQFRCRARTVGRTDFILLLVLILLSHSFELIHIGALHACSLHKYYINNNNCIPNYCIIK